MLTLTGFTGRSVSSQELVPGDVYEFSDPSLNQVPCDCILLSGDCIVNESMLTGLCNSKTSTVTRSKTNLVQANLFLYLKHLLRTTLSVISTSAPLLFILTLRSISCSVEQKLSELDALKMSMTMMQWHWQLLSEPAS